MADTSDKKPELLPLWVKVTTLFISIAFAGWNLYSAWGEAAEVQRRLQFQPKTDFPLIARFIEQAAGSAAGDGGLDARDRLTAASYMFVTYSQFSTAANVQAQATLACSGGMSMLAIGFSLFLIGADGAFRIQAEHGSNAKVMLSGTTPGLLCFVVACILLVVGATTRAKIDSGGVRFGDAASAPPIDPSKQHTSIP